MEKNESMIKVDSPIAEMPLFVEFEKMTDMFAEINRKTAERAFNNFLQRRVEFHNRLNDWLAAESEMLRPAPAKITETKKTVKVSIAVPGFKADEIEVSVKDNKLYVSGETFGETMNEDEATYYSDWRSNRFFRQLALPAEVDVEKVDAKLKDGMLTMTLKKMAAKPADKAAAAAA